MTLRSVGAGAAAVESNAALRSGSKELALKQTLVAVIYRVDWLKDAKAARQNVGGWVGVLRTVSSLKLETSAVDWCVTRRTHACLDILGVYSRKHPR